MSTNFSLLTLNTFVISIPVGTTFLNFCYWIFITNYVPNEKSAYFSPSGMERFAGNNVISVCHGNQVSQITGAYNLCDFNPSIYEKHKGKL
jgi:hypothetical protein